MQETIYLHLMFSLVFDTINGLLPLFTILYFRRNCTDLELLHWAREIVIE